MKSIQHFLFSVSLFFNYLSTFFDVVKKEIDKPVALRIEDLTPVRARIMVIETGYWQNDKSKPVTIARTTKGTFLVNVMLNLKQGMEYDLKVVKKDENLGVVVFAESTALEYSLQYQQS